MSPRAVAWIRLSRPHFLLGGALMYGLGVGFGGGVNTAAYTSGQLLVSMAQLTAHFVNEYADMEADMAVENRTLFSGGSGVLVSGTLPASTALRAGLITSALTLVAAAVVATISPVAAVLGVLALGVSWGYSMPPVRLLATGWGELATSLVVAVVVPWIGAAMTGSAPQEETIWAMAVLLPIHIAMMLAFEIPDMESDRKAGKLVLAVRIGPRWTTALILVLDAIAVLAIVLASTVDGFGGGLLWAAASVAILGPGSVAAMQMGAHGAGTALAVASLVSAGSIFLAAGPALS